MKLRNRILSIFAIVVALAFVSLAVALSYNSPCSATAALPAGSESMTGLVARCYGAPDVLTVEQVAKPTPNDDQLLVKVHAAALNPVDWHTMRGSPYIMRLSSGLGSPKDARVGVDFAGTVEAVGKNVTRFKPGDAVFGGVAGAVAEYVVVRETRAVALKPANVSFEQAGSVGVAAATALQGLRDEAGIKPGQKVLINGASGGVGTFAVQIAKSMGAEVTGVCSTPNVDMVRSLGADHVIDYTQENFTEGKVQYDLILDMVGNHSLLALGDVMRPDGILVIVGGSNEGNFLGAMTRPINAFLLSPFVSQSMGMMLAELNPEDLSVMSELMQSGKVTPVIDRSYSLSDVPEAVRYVEDGHARGKVIISIE